jgi:TRAP-type mannitol/chloroaromatic compound transport system substrate-binding protein
MEAGHRATKELFAEISAKNARFRKVLEHMSRFHEDQLLWFRVAEGSFDNFMATGRKAAPAKPAPKS